MEEIFDQSADEMAVSASEFDRQNESIEKVRPAEPKLVPIEITIQHLVLLVLTG